MNHISPRTAVRQTGALESELVLLCAAPVKDQRHYSQIEAILEQDLDWTLAERFADRHRLLPLLYWELKALRHGNVPPGIAAAFERNLQNNMFMTGELFRVLDLLEAAGIPALAFKGPTLAAGTFGQIALRMFCDLDILVRAEDFPAASEIMFDDGYKTKARLNPARYRKFLRCYDELTMHRDDGYPLLELHWDLIPRHFSISLDIGEIWSRRDSVQIGSRAVPSLAPEDLFLMLCIHGAKHCWSHIGLITDVAWAMARHRLDWAQVLRRARDARMHRIVLLSAVLASQMLQVELPEALARALSSDPGVPLLAGEILDKLFSTGHNESDILESGLLYMRMREHLRDRFRYAFRLLTRPAIEDWQVVDLPRGFDFVYSVIRYPRLALKYRPRAR